MKVIVTVCIKKGDKIILVKEGIPKAYGLWNMPGGHLDEEEGIVEGAIREAKEETGYDVKITSILSIQRYFTDGIVKINFNAEVIGGSVCFDANEILEVKEMTIEEIEKLEDNTLRGASVFRDMVQDMKQEKAYDLEMIKTIQ